MPLCTAAHPLHTTFTDIFGASASGATPPRPPPPQVVLEPLSAMSDGFNNHAGLHVLSAGERFSNSFGIRLE